MSDDFTLDASRLVRTLEAAEAGDAALDLKIIHILEIDAPAFAPPGDVALMHELAPATIRTITGDTVAPYTRSLDAALPGENIVFAMFSERRGRWVAVQRAADRTETVAWARTEALARRAAALRALAGIASPGGGDSVAGVPGSHGAAARGPGGPPDPGAGEDDAPEDFAPDAAWKVRF